MPITITVQRHLPASATEVFALAVDPARFPFPGYGPIAAVRTITLDASLAVGSTRKIHNADGSVLTETVTVLDAPRHHAYELSGFVAPFAWLVQLGEADWRLRPAGDGTDVTWTYRFTLASALAWPLAAPLLHVFMQRAMARSLAAMAAIVSDRGQA